MSSSVLSLRSGTASSRLDMRLAQRFTFFCRVIGGLTLGFSVAVIAGWVFDVHALTHPFGGTLTSSSAIGLALASAALLLELSNRPRLRWVAKALAAIVLLSGIATFVEDISQQDLGLNHIWYQTSQDSPGISYPGPMPPPVSFMFALIASGLLAFGLKVKRSYPYQYALLIAAVVAAMPLIGQSFGAMYLCTFAGCLKLPPASCITFLALSASALFSVPEIGITEIFVKSGVGGKLARRFTLALLVLPVLLAIRNMGEKAGWWDAALGWVLFALATIGLLITSIVKSASSLETLDEEKTEALQALDEAISAYDKASTTARRAQIKKKNICLACSNEFPDEFEICPNDGEILTKLADDPLIGTTVADRYEIESLLGAGGMSRVYKAKHMSLPKQYAIKFLHTYLTTDLDAIKRFQREAKAASLLAHPHLITAHDFGISEDGQPYLVMDYIEGKSLADILHTGRLSVETALPLFLQLCDGMSYAHNQGLIHRDLKPGNVMVLKQDERLLVKIVDLGLAKSLALDVSGKLTQTGEVFGSPQYMSPEQCLGKQLDGRTDIYSLGCIMYECITGTPPLYDDSPIALMKKQITDLPPPFASHLQVPQWLSKEIFKAMEKKVSRRHQTVGELYAALLAGRSSIAEVAG